MANRRRSYMLLALSVAVLIVAWVFLGTHHCPQAGIAFTANRRALHRLKNRTGLPQVTDFDDLVTLDSLLQPGNDQGRWSTSRAARIEGHVVSIGEAGVELANCYVRRDIHINLARTLDAPVTQQVVLEVTPPMQDWARARGWDWSAEQLQKDLTGRWCRFEGWLFFDSTHASESENLAPGRTGNWRATAWEIHPITKFEVVGSSTVTNRERKKETVLPVSFWARTEVRVQ